MLTPRRAIVLSVAIVVFSVTWSVLSLLREPDSGGAAADSYGTRRDGQRGLYETMQELGLPVSRSLEPPGRLLPYDTTVVIWRPDARLVSQEPRFLHELGEWIQEGGRVVVTPPDEDDSVFEWMEEEPELPTLHPADTLWNALGLGDQAPTSEWTSVVPAVEIRGAGTAAAAGDRVGASEAEIVHFDVHTDGPLADTAADVKRLAAAYGEVQTLGSADESDDGSVTLRDTDGVDRGVVRRFAVGKGEVLVVGDERLFSNELLASADNSVLAVRLMLGDRARVQFNEFYHGLSVRGNPLWLLTRRGYALLTIAVLGVIAVTTWRSAVLLGPPLNTPEPSRRTVGEYVDAMSRFLNRGRRTRVPLLQEVWAGTLRRIAAEHGVAQGREDAATLVRTVARRNRDRAERLQSAAAAVDDVVAKQDKATEKEVVQALRQLQDCL